MNLLELQTFLAIVETGSLVRASERLNVTQSTVTARLKSLESQLGQSLINRHKSGATPTPSGHKLTRYAQTISQLWSQAQIETALPDAMSSVCNIGCDPDLWRDYVEYFLDYIHQNIPQVGASVWQGRPRELSSWLQNGLIDISFGYAPNPAQTQELIPAISDELILVSTCKDSPARSDAGYIFIEAGEKFGRDHAAAYADTNVARTSFSNANLGLDYMLRHGGSAYLPRRIAAPYLTRQELFELKNAPTFQRRAYIVINKQAANGWPWLRDCLEHIRQR